MVMITLWLFNVAGNFVVVDDSGREEAVESGRKVSCIVVQVLFHEQVRLLQKSPEWSVLRTLLSSNIFAGLFLSRRDLKRRLGCQMLSITFVYYAKSSILEKKPSHPGTHKKHPGSRF